MNDSKAEKPEYGNWILPRFVYLPALAALLFLGLSYIFLPFIGAASFCLLVSGYLAYARYRFSPAGGDLQAEIRAGVLSHLDWDGKGTALDVGCGNGALVSQMAQKYREAKVVGIDYWGPKWEYSKGVCSRNARLEGVAQRVVFQNASGSALPFKEGCFEVVISNLAFHEVRDAKDKREVIREALRVVKKGGRFVFQDLFLLRRIYGQIDDLVAAVRGMGITRVKFVRTGNAPFIPTVLKLPAMVGALGILYGEK